MKHTLLLVLLGLSSILCAQMQQETHSFLSKTYNKERKLSIYLPSNYGKDTTKTFPVMYVFDGQEERYLDVVSSLIEYQSAYGNGLSFIIVGIHSNDRWEEFLSKMDEKGIVMTNAGSHRFSTFLNSEVETYLKSNYRINAIRIGTGHSLGGTFVIQEMLQPKSLFQAGIIISPNIVYNENELSKQIHSFFENPKDAHRYFFVRSGTVGNPEAHFNEQLEKLAHQLESNKNAKTMWNFEVLSGENHMSIFPTAFLQGYQAISATYEFNPNLLAKGKTLKTEDYACMVKDFQKQKALLYPIPKELTALETFRMAIKIRDADNTKGALAVLNLAEELSQNGKHLTPEEDNLITRITGLKKSLIMNELNEEALALYRNGQIKEAVSKYKDAFAMDFLQGTHNIRITAVPILAEAGETELAFEQLELLANTFKLKGNERFMDDERCVVLHKDKRWKGLMKVLEENRK